MEQQYAKLNTQGLSEKISYYHPERPNTLVHEDSPAFEVFTDFKSKPPATCEGTDTTEQALHKMQQNKVKSLLVINDKDHVVGIIHIRDLHGLKLGQVASSQGIRPTEVPVKRIMNPCGATQCLDYKDLSNARVGHIVRLLHEDNLAHLLVVETCKDDKNKDYQVVRGIFSAGRISRLMGQSVQGDLSSHSIAEFNKRL